MARVLGWAPSSSPRIVRTTSDEVLHRRLLPFSFRGHVGYLQPVHGHLQASNFERFIFDLLGRDGDTRADTRPCPRRLLTCPHPGSSLSLRDTYGFISGTSTHADCLVEIARTEQESGYLDLHIGRRYVHATCAVLFPDLRIKPVVMETACLPPADTISRHWPLPA